MKGSVGLSDIMKMLNRYMVGRYRYIDIKIDSTPLSSLRNWLALLKLPYQTFHYFLVTENIDRDFLRA